LNQLFKLYRSFQIRHSKWVTGKFVFLKDLCGLMAKAPVFGRGFFYFYFNYSGFEITPTQWDVFYFVVVMWYRGLTWDFVGKFWDLAAK
jgi:hypothetical protein